MKGINRSTALLIIFATLIRHSL